MSTHLVGTVAGPYTIQVETPLPYQNGAEVVLQIDPGTPKGVQQAQDMLRCLRSLVGIASSGVNDVSENKHRYLAEAYGCNNEPAAE